MFRDAIAFIAWVALAIALAWAMFGWEVGAGVALMAAAAGIADLIWARLTGATVSEWFWRRGRQRWYGVAAFVGLLAFALLMHLLGF